MKKFWTVFGVLGLSVFVLAIGHAGAQDVQNFKIASFHAEYYLTRNSAKTAILHSVETIQAQFPDFDQNHGILRAIPETYQGHTTSLKIDSVTDENNNSINYTTYKQNDNLVLKIGDADRYVHGLKTYKITYDSRNVVVFLNDHDEFYWDANGDQWPQSFDSVSARLHLSGDLARMLQDRQTCYAGASGSRNENACTITRETSNDETLISVQTNQPLNPYETLTFVTAFNKNTFLPGPEIAHERRVHNAKIAAATGLIALPPLGAFIFMYRRWRQFGNDPKGRGVIVPEYEPPKGFTTLTSDFLLQQKSRNLAFSAAIIELAVKRYLTIYEIKQKKRLKRDTTDYELELNLLPNDLPNELKKVANVLFEDAVVGARVKLSDIKKQAATGGLRTDMKNLEDSLASGLYKKSYFIKNPKKVRNGYLAWAGGIFAVAFVLFFTIWTSFLAIGLLLAASMLFAFSLIMPARTEKGVEAHDALLGLKDYIKLAEAERLRFGQSVEGAEKIAQGSFDPTDPKMKIKLFETLLPYAILFGLEKSWAKQFADLYKSPPDWYQGNWTAFNTGYLAASLSNFQTVSSQTFVSPSSSGGSGFSGGSGGGGGGGGGGGW